MSSVLQWKKVGKEALVGAAVTAGRVAAPAGLAAANVHPAARVVALVALVVPAALAATSKRLPLNIQGQ